MKSAVFLAPINRALQSPYLKAISTLSGGQLFALILPILAAPILGRLYTPADYGILAIITAPIAVITPIATLQLQSAMVVAKTRYLSEQLFVICALSSLVVGLISAVSLGLLNLSGYFSDLNVAWYFIVPVIILTTGFVSGSSAMSNVVGAHKWISAAQVVQGLVSISISVGLGSLGWGALGLVTSYAAGNFAVVAFWFSRRNKLLRHSVTFSASRSFVLLKRFRKFPLFTAPSEILAQATLQAPIFALSFFGMVDTVGSLTRARQLVSIPLGLVASSIAPVFYRRAAQDYQFSNNARPIYIKTLMMLLFVTMPIGVLLFLFAPMLFVFYLGPNWAEAGVIARALAPMLILSCINAPLSTIILVRERFGLDLFISVIFLVFSYAAFAVSSLIGLSGYGAIQVYSVVCSSIFISTIVITFRLSKAIARH